MNILNQYPIDRFYSQGEKSSTLNNNDLHLIAYLMEK
jgi:hypothetical protein